MALTFIEFKEIVRREYLKLSELEDYLNDAGLARLGAFKEVNNLIPFCDSIEELYNWDYFQEICNRPAHTEYSKVMRMINYSLDRAVTAKKDRKGDSPINV